MFSFQLEKVAEEAQNIIHMKNKDITKQKKNSDMMELQPKNGNDGNVKILKDLEKNVNNKNKWELF